MITLGDKLMVIYIIEDAIIIGFANGNRILRRRMKKTEPNFFQFKQYGQSIWVSSNSILTKLSFRSG